MVEYGRPVED